MAAASDIGILAPSVVRAPALPRRWRRRGEFAALAGLDETALLARAFGVEARDLSAAPLHYLGMTGRDPGGYCLYAYPVYLHARREQLVLMTGPEFEPGEGESESLVALLREHFAEWRVERTADGMWFVIVDQDPDLVTTPLQHVLGEDINDHLPCGADAMTWHGILNELQMLLFDSEVNRKREADGRPPLNSLWLWGGGRLPALPSPSWRRVVTNNPVALGMARQAGIECHWQEHAPAQEGPGDQDVTAPGTLWAVSPATSADGQTPVLSAAQWRALRESLRRRDIDRLVLTDPGHGELIVDRRTAVSWWPW